MEICRNIKIFSTNIMNIPIIVLVIAMAIIIIIVIIIISVYYKQQIDANHTKKMIQANSNIQQTIKEQNQRMDRILDEEPEIGSCDIGDDTLYYINEDKPNACNVQNCVGADGKSYYYYPFDDKPDQCETLTCLGVDGYGTELRKYNFIQGETKPVQCSYSECKDNINNKKYYYSTTLPAQCNSYTCKEVDRYGGETNVQLPYRKDKPNKCRTSRCRGFLDMYYKYGLPYGDHPACRNPVLFTFRPKNHQGYTLGSLYPLIDIMDENTFYLKYQVSSTANTSVLSYNTETNELKHYNTDKYIVVSGFPRQPSTTLLATSNRNEAIHGFWFIRYRYGAYVYIKVKKIRGLQIKPDGLLNIKFDKVFSNGDIALRSTNYSRIEDVPKHERENYLFTIHYYDEKTKKYLD